MKQRTIVLAALTGRVREAGAQADGLVARDRLLGDEAAGLERERTDLVTRGQRVPAIVRDAQCKKRTDAEPAARRLETAPRRQTPACRLPQPAPRISPDRAQTPLSAMSSRGGRLAR